MNHVADVMHQYSIAFVSCLVQLLYKTLKCDPVDLDYDLIFHCRILTLRKSNI